jgi:hypothetical protein
MRILFPSIDLEYYYIDSVAISIGSTFSVDIISLLLDNLEFYTANDQEPPIFQKKWRDQEHGKAGIPVEILADVIDEGIGVASVFLVFSMDNGKTWTEQAMPLKENITYATTVKIKAYFDLTIMIYYIQAIDQFGNTAMSNATGNLEMLLFNTVLNWWQFSIAGAGALITLVGLSAMIIKMKRRKKGLSKNGKSKKR